MAKSGVTLLFGTAAMLGCGDAGSGSSEGSTSAPGDTSSSGSSETGTSETPEDVLWSDRLINIAHAGGKGTRPEHTMLAYETALADGADVLELDIHATSDGVIVLMHDETIDRTTDGEGRISDMTFDELRAFDAGYTFTEDGETYPFRGMGLVVPSLDEVFEAYPDVPYVIELKQESPSIVAPFLAMTDEYGIRDQMVASAFSDTLLTELRSAAPDVPTSFATNEVLEFMGLTEDTEASYEPPGEFLQVPLEQIGIPVLTPEFAARAKRLELPVHAWTINDEAELQMLIDLEIEGIITDYPARLRDLLQ